MFGIRRRVIWSWVAGALTVAVICRGVADRAWDRSARAELNQARAELDTGLVATATARLRALADGHRQRDEALELLGRCEQTLGRNDAALAAWGRIAASSPLYPRVAADRGALLLNTGHYRAAEEFLLRALPTARAPADRHHLLRELSRVYRFQGRVDDIRRVLRSTWDVAPDRAALLRELWLLDMLPQPVDAWGMALLKADPADDRVQLGKIAVAHFSGRDAEASTLLDDLERARPDDPAVARARLDVARATNDEPGVWRAAQRLGVDTLEPSVPLAVRAWLLARRDDRDAERAALRALIAADPADFAALTRLAALEIDAGHRPEAEAIYRAKAEVDQAKDRARKILVADSGYATAAAELSRACDRLGRPFEAWGWSHLTAPTPPSPSKSANTATLRDDLAAVGLSPRSEARVVAAAAAALPSTLPQFTDDAKTAGLTFTFRNGETAFHYLPETMSGGVGVLDYDGDGWLDVYVVQGGPVLNDPTAAPVPNGDRLFHNERDGTFRDVTDVSRISTFARDYGLGVAAGDYDGDGRPDVFISRLRSYALYRNNGDGTFADVTERAGLSGRRDNPTSAAFADLDGDGDLDLYVCHYMIWDDAHLVVCPDDKGRYLSCDPSKVERSADHVFRNDGGHFVDVTKEAGFTDPDGRGLGVVASDLDDDGKIDIYVANDGTANYLFRNLGGFRFEEIGHAAGVAAGPEGGYQASMGIALGDYDGDGLPDLVVTNFYAESSTLYRNLGGGLFRDQTAASGLAAASRYLLGFGTSFADVDHDGRLDLVTANGHVNDARPTYPYAMPCQLLLNRPGNRFVDASDRAGAPWRVERVGRGLAVADLDNDGRLDALVLAQNDPLAYFHNHGPSSITPGGALTLALEGAPPGSNRDAVGARVEIVAAGQRQVSWRFGGGSYQSAGDPRLHFGLGAAARVDTVHVRWPSGRVDRFGPFAAGTGWRLVEGSPTAAPLPGFPSP